jgi:hypothetical protein
VHGDVAFPEQGVEVVGGRFGSRRKGRRFLSYTHVVFLRADARQANFGTPEKGEGGWVRAYVGTSARYAMAGE